MNVILELDRDFKRKFFDRPFVMKRLTIKEQKYLAKAGAKTMYNARGRIRKKLKRRPVQGGGLPPAVYLARVIAEQRRRASKPGESPRGKTLKKTILFNFDPPRAVVVGPIGFGTGVPKLLEFGGPYSFTIPRRKGGHIQGRAVMAPRPFMRPTLRAVAPQLPGLYAGINL